MAEQETKHGDWYIVHKNVAGTMSSREKKDKLETELEEALEKGYNIIVIEPRLVGDEVIRWIKFGNFLHKSAVLASIGSLILLPTLPRHLTLYISLPLGVFGITCATLYNVSWQFDPCCKYQVDWQGKELSDIPSHELTATSPVVLVRRNDIYRKILHSSLAFIVFGYITWKWYTRE